MALKLYKLKFLLYQAQLSPCIAASANTEKKPRSIGDGGNLSSRQRVSELRGSLLRQFVVKVYKTGAVHCVLPHCALDPPHCEQAWEKWEGQVTLVQILVILHSFFGQIVPKSNHLFKFSSKANTASLNRQHENYLEPVPVYKRHTKNN